MQRAADERPSGEATPGAPSRTTHREAARPTLSARFLADYLAAGARERARRTLIQNAKYRVAARMIQHVQAKSAVARFLASAERDVATLLAQAEELRGRNTADQFAADLNRHNAEYLERFAAAYPGLVLPDAAIALSPKPPAVTIAGVKVNLEMPLRLRRIARGGRPRIGGAALRYAKGRPLAREAGKWQAAFLFGYLGLTEPEDGAAPEHQLCLVIDAQAGEAIPAPGNALARFHEMEAACASIAERWNQIEPPAGAVLETAAGERSEPDADA